MTSTSLCSLSTPFLSLKNFFQTHNNYLWEKIFRSGNSEVSEVSVVERGGESFFHAISGARQRSNAPARFIRGGAFELLLGGAGGNHLLERLDVTRRGRQRRRQDEPAGLRRTRRVVDAGAFRFRKPEREYHRVFDLLFLRRGGLWGRLRLFSPDLRLLRSVFHHFLHRGIQHRIGRRVVRLRWRKECAEGIEISSATFQQSTGASVAVQPRSGVPTRAMTRPEATSRPTARQWRPGRETWR